MADRVDWEPARAQGPRPRLALICLHTSPTASLGQSANGGLNVYVREICSGLSACGIATDVFTRSHGSGSIQVESLANLSRVIYLPASRPAPDKYALLDEVTDFGLHLAGFIADSGLSYSAVYSHYWLSGAVMLGLRERLHLPWLHTAHTLARVKNRHLAPGARPEPEVRARIETEIAREADLLIVSTSSEGEDMVLEYGADPARLAVIAPGVDLRGFSPRERSRARAALGREGQRLLLFVGRLERLKGVEIILRAFHLAADRRHPDARLVILGEDSDPGIPSERARLAGIVGDLGLTGRVEFVGPVPQRELGLWYSASEACLLPSYTESFGLVGLEAQACGTPVIASNLAGFASVVRDGVTGFLVDGPDPAMYAERMGRILADPDLSLTMGRRGTLLAQRFSWTRTVDSLIRYLDELTSIQGDVQAGIATE
ncbi:MAG TPA: glycosyltransferase [Candidatus Nitrosotalea sp.]|nr:glycosyltransferase [Candidatus Nitrosotalea sp.]